MMATWIYPDRHQLFVRVSKTSLDSDPCSVIPTPKITKIGTIFGPLLFLSNGIYITIKMAIIYPAKIPTNFQ
jgi:hypothetical protein